MFSSLMSWILAVLVWVLWRKSRKQNKQIARLEIDVQSLQSHLNQSDNESTSPEAAISDEHPKFDDPVPSEQTTAVDPWTGKPELTKAGLAKEQASQTEEKAFSSVVYHSSIAASASSADDQLESTGNGSSFNFGFSKDFDFVERLKEQWMVWLGALSMSLAGIFMVKYSMDQGYLGPTARIISGIMFGLALHGTAEWMRRKHQDLYDSISALAGAGSIALYAAILAALHLYELIPNWMAFVALAAISLLTMALALLHGPVAAAIGIVGAYAVPVLVSDGSGQISVALIYSLIITASALLLLRQVYRIWLWAAVFIGAMFWWLVSLDVQQDIFAWQGIYLAILAYLFLAIEPGNFLLRQSEESDKIHYLSKFKSTKADIGSGFTWLQDYLSFSQGDLNRFIAMVCIIVAQALSLALSDAWLQSFFQWLPMMALVFLVSRHNKTLQLLPWLLFISHWIAILAASINHGGLWALSFDFYIEKTTDLFGWLAAIALLTSFMSLWNQNLQTRKGLTASLAWLAPVFLILLAYLVLDDVAGDLYWSLGTLALATIYVGFISYDFKSGNAGINTVWLIIASHFAYSLAAVIAFSEATLTLALAAQLLPLVYIRQQTSLKSLGVVIKVIMLLVVTRLTLNPWLLTYDMSTHWSLWTYGGSVLILAASSYLCRAEPILRRWLEAVAIHLLVLFLNVELRFWLYDGDVFAQSYSLVEAGINTLLWAALSMVYWYRSSLAQWGTKLYQFASRLLMALAVLSYLGVLFIMNPVWGISEVSSTPIFNELLLVYGAPIVLWALASMYFESRYKTRFRILTGFSAWIFVTLEIRHLWQELLHKSMFWYTGVSSAELYTYSIIWLLMALAALLWGSLKYNQNLYKAGIALLGLVIAKIFLIDMDGLTGLLRVASFLGLGLSLLGLGYLHQRLSQTKSGPPNDDKTVEEVAT